MQTTANQLKTFIDQHVEALKLLPESDMVFKPAPGKWSKKEIIGHLIDSAQSNIRRFVIAQYEDSPSIVYYQDKWVTIVNYQQWNTNDLVNLWYLLNIQAAEILKNTSVEIAQRKCKTQDVHSIEWLAADYIKHLRHHIHLVLELEPVAYP